MVGLPRVLTVDPSGACGRVVRAALELAGWMAIQVDMPSGLEALEELNCAIYDVIVLALVLDDSISGDRLALRIREMTPDTTIIVLGADDDPEQVAQTIEGAALYLRRPSESLGLARLLHVALEGGDVFEPEPAPPPLIQPLRLDLGEIPPLDIRIAQKTVDKLISDVGAMAIIVASRDGSILLERGTFGSLDRARMVRGLLPSVQTQIEMMQVTGGHMATLGFFDGSDYDVFVLSVGVHHFMCIVYDGQSGRRNFGAVNGFGRRACEDMIALLGERAYKYDLGVPTLTLPPPTPPPPAPKPAPPPEPRKASPARPTPAPVRMSSPPPPPIEELDLSPLPDLPESEPLSLEPLQGFSLDIFDQVGGLDTNLADDLFDPETLGQIAANDKRGAGQGPLTYDEARELGIIP